VVAIAVVDLTSIGDDAVAEMQAAVSKATGVAPANILVVAGHSFSAPHMFSPEHMPPGMTPTAEEAGRMTAYHEAVLASVSQAAKQAMTRMQGASLRFASATADVNVNRNVPMADGWWLGANDAGPSDKTLGVLRIDGTSGKPIAVLINYAVQSAVMDHSINVGGGKTATSDLGGAAVGHIENRYGGQTVSLFLTGAAGDQLPGYTARTYRYDVDGHFKVGDIGDAGFTLVGAQGGRLGEAAVRASQASKAIPKPAPLRIVSGSVSLDAQQRPDNLQQIQPRHSYTFAVKGKTNAPFWILQIGDVAIVGVQAELSAVTGQRIRQESPFTHTMVVTMVNGAAKYMPDASGYKDITYEAMNAPYGPGSAEVFAAHIITELKSLHRQK
jgi:hypothetical protein